MLLNFFLSAVLNHAPSYCFCTFNEGNNIRMVGQHLFPIQPYSPKRASVLYYIRSYLSVSGQATQKYFRLLDSLYFHLFFWIRILKNVTLKKENN